MYNIENHNYDNKDSMNAKEEANMVRETSAAQKIAEVIADIEAREKAIQFQYEQLTQERAEFDLTKKHFKSLYALKEERLNRNLEYVCNWEDELRTRELRLLNDYAVARFDFEESIGASHRVQEEVDIKPKINPNIKPDIHIKDKDDYKLKYYDLEDLMNRLCVVLNLDDPKMNFFENLYSEIVHMEEEPEYRVAFMEALINRV